MPRVRIWWVSYERDDRCLSAEREYKRGQALCVFHSPRSYDRAFPFVASKLSLKEAAAFLGMHFCWPPFLTFSRVCFYFHPFASSSLWSKKVVSPVLLILRWVGSLQSFSNTVDWSFLASISAWLLRNCSRSFIWSFSVFERSIKIGLYVGKFGEWSIDLIFFLSRIWSFARIFLCKMRFFFLFLVRSEDISELCEKWDGWCFLWSKALIFLKVVMEILCRFLYDEVGR